MRHGPAKTGQGCWSSLNRSGLSRPHRRQRITQIITSQPPRAWSGRELAQLPGIKPRNMHTQLGEWTKLGFFTRTGYGTYALNTPGQPSSTTANGP